MIIDKFIVHMLDINLDKPMLADFIGKDYIEVMLWNQKYMELLT